MAEILQKHGSRHVWPAVGNTLLDIILGCMNALFLESADKTVFTWATCLAGKGSRSSAFHERCGDALSATWTKREQVEALVRKHQPDYIFHLAANSTTRHDALFENHEAIATGTLAILDAVDRLAPKAKVLLAGSGLQFVNQGLPLNEESPLDHSSPYVVARNSSLFAARYFRQRGLKIYFAYLFNHDSPLRSNRHLNMKIAEAAARAANGSKEKLLIGDLDAEKEFNFAGDVAAAMWLLIRQDELFECVVGSGQSHAVRDWIEACFREVGLDWNDYTETDRTYASPYRRLVSDPAKLLSLGWKPECTFSGLAAMMMAEAARRCEVSERKADGP